MSIGEPQLILSYYCRLFSPPILHSYSGNPRFPTSLIIASLNCTRPLLRRRHTFPTPRQLHIWAVRVALARHHFPVDHCRSCSAQLWRHPVQRLAPHLVVRRSKHGHVRQTPAGDIRLMLYPFPSPSSSSYSFPLIMAGRNIASQSAGPKVGQRVALQKEQSQPDCRPHRLL
jgi:hypothetical protein